MADLIIFLSGSGNSMNLVKAARYGLKEKFKMAAILGYKGGALKDLVDIPKKVREDIKIIPVETADEVLKIALTKELKPIEWSEVDKISEGKKDDKSQASIQ